MKISHEINYLPTMNVVMAFWLKEHHKMDKVPNPTEFYSKLIVNDSNEVVEDANSIIYQMKQGVRHTNNFTTTRKIEFTWNEVKDALRYFFKEKNDLTLEDVILEQPNRGKKPDRDDYYHGRDIDWNIICVFADTDEPLAKLKTKKGKS